MVFGAVFLICTTPHAEWIDIHLLTHMSNFMVKT